MLRQAYPSDVRDEEWAFVVPYLTLLSLDAAQRQHDLREVFNALRLLVRTGSQTRYLPHDLPPWPTVYQRTQRWLAAGCFEAMAHDLRALLRIVAERDMTPSAVVLDSRTLQASPESGHRVGYDGAKPKKGSKVHIAVDTLGHLLTLHVTPATEQDRAQVATLAAVRTVTGDTVELAYVDQGYPGETAATAVATHGLRLEVIKPPEARRGFVLLPQHWVVERSFARMARLRRLARDYERSATTLTGLYYVAFACLMPHRAFDYASVHNSF